MMETKQYIYEIVHINDLDFDHYLSLIKKVLTGKNKAERVK